MEQTATAAASPVGGVGPLPKRRWTPVSALEFVGCESCRMTLQDYEDYPEDGRKIEFFDSEAELAWMLRDGARREHEEPSRRLPALVHEISQTRGSRIRWLGASQVRLLDADSGRVRVIHPDEMVFLDPERAGHVGLGFLRVGEDAFPDVVLEVDHTTDIRQSKLMLYEEWGFPELWVEVPSVYSTSRPRKLKPELRIYLLGGAGYAVSEESRAFPGWRAEEIHRALNEPVVSPATSAVLERVGRALGEREGTGPDDDPLLGRHRTESLAKGRAEGRAEMAGLVLRQRGVIVPSGFPDAGSLEALRAVTTERVLAAATGATSFADFLSRLR